MTTRGSSATGQYALSQIESVNASTGNVGLSIPLAHLPPGPGDLATGVNLTYNSTIYDIQSAIPGNPLQYRYASSLHGGGWNYSFNYTLWSQPRYPDFNLSDQCDGIGTVGQHAWFKNYLQTPDGSNHVLTLVATIQDGVVTSPPSTSIARDPNDAYWQYDVGGNTSQSCGLTNTQFLGTLVFASSDSTYIRVEVSVYGGFGSWIAYLADGSQVSSQGWFPTIVSPGGHANDSDALWVIDRNGNQLIFDRSCASGPCTVTVGTKPTDSGGVPSPGRSITIQYGSNTGGTWTDTITWPGIHGNLTTNVDWASLTPDSSISYYNLVNPDGSTYTASTINLAANLTSLPMVVNSIELPAATSGGAFSSFTFGYSSWGEVHSLAMSTGTTGNLTQQYNATYTYCYDVGISCPLATYPRPPATAVNPITNKVLQYSTTTETTSYSILGPSNAFSYPQTGTAGQVTYPDGSVSEIFTANLCSPSFKSRDFCPALPYKILNRDGSVTLMGWTSNPTPGSLPSSAIFNPYVQYRTQTPPGLSVSNGAQITQDQNGNPTTLYEYDWLSSGSVLQGGGTFVTSISGTAARTTNTAYFQPTPNPTYWQQYGVPTYLRAKQTVMVNSMTCASAAACTTYTYDNALTTANLTQVQQYDSTINNNITSTFTYLANGNLASQTDPNGVITLICYGTNNLYPVARFVGATSTACPSPSMLTEGRTTTYSIDFNSGLPSAVADADNSITTTFTYDDLGRQKTVEEQAGSLDRTTTTIYDDVNLSVATSSDDLPGQPLTSKTFYDPVGRVIQIQNGSGTSTNLVDKVYSFSATAHRSYELTSNPHYAADNTTGWTVTTRDPAGRVTRVDNYAGASQPTPGSTDSLTGTVTTTYDVATSGCAGPTVNVTDEANNTHINCPDGLGRLAAVTEPDGTQTNYGHDPLNNLVAVDVAGQSNSTCTLPDNSTHGRCFVYSTLSRLKSATNPESGPVSYVYDGNGNLVQKTDAIGTVTALGPYDGLARLKKKTYSVGGMTVTTPSVFYTYDVGFKGGLSSVCTSTDTSSCISPVSTTTYTHDAFGRIVTSTQTTASNPAYQFTYAYSLTDQLTYMKYPSGRQVKYGLDAADRIATIQNVNANTNYAAISYTAPGGISTMTTGNGVSQQVTWNDRLQPIGLQVNSASNSSLLTLGFYPCPSNATSCTTGNNGNLQSQSIAFPALNGSPALNLTQVYSYGDNLNRLTGVTEGGVSLETYGYAGNGNRWVSYHSQVAPAVLPSLTQETPQASNAFTSANQVVGWTYDANGNVIQPGIAARSFTYDAENRQVTATINGSTASYSYDGNGLRVSKTWNSQTTTYVYDAFGNLAAEYSGAASGSPCGTPTCYVTADHLGSTRMLTDKNGSTTVRRYDYLPFGDEILSGINGRDAAGMGYPSSPDNLLEKFTGQDRDSETANVNSGTGLDWFQTRYFSSTQGRFQSVDPANAGASIADPQTWNGYSYVGNNPLTYTDPSGECFWCILGGAVLDAIGALTGQGELVAIGQTIAGIGGASSIAGGIIGDISSGVNSGPWNEQVPLGGPGALQGAINSGIVIENFENASGGVWYENLPTFPTWFVDVVSGAGDALTFRLTSKIRDRMGSNSVVNQCSGWYESGALAPLAFGVGRLAYAGAAKAIPLLVRGGATEMETALAGSAMRESIKRIGNFGMKPLRSYTQDQIIAKYEGDPAKIMSAATRTSPGFNAAGGAAIGAAVGALAGRPSYCK
ncbi:MAG TPA: RHS repeat-associated core domain-containing protein [Bryobacteraceae bacterium]|nr:RHS repeat-associated core domain-containing protein [Bryobacteraceae bacterium]